MRSTLFAASVLVAAVSPAFADVVIADTEFNDSNWGFETVQIGTGGSGSGVQVTGVGNPGKARRVTLSPNAGGTIWGFSRYGNTLATRYVPSVDGAIASINFSFDARLVSGSGDGQAVMVALKQGQVIYGASYSVTGSSGGWATFAQTGLVASDFLRLDGLAGVPNFSETGAPIRFGIASGNSAPNASYTTVADYDNFVVTIVQVPAPGAAGLLAAAAVLAARRRR